jgi:hypothetical protein
MKLSNSGRDLAFLGLGGMEWEVGHEISVFVVGADSWSGKVSGFGQSSHGG